MDGQIKSCVLRSCGGSLACPYTIIELGEADTDGGFGVPLGHIGSWNWTTGRVQIDGVEFVSDFSIETLCKSNYVSNKADTILVLVNGGVIAFAG